MKAPYKLIESTAGLDLQRRPGERAWAFLFLGALAFIMCALVKGEWKE